MRHIWALRKLEEKQTLTDTSCMCMMYVECRILMYRILMYVEYCLTNVAVSNFPPFSTLHRISLLINDVNILISFFKDNDTRPIHYIQLGKDQIK